MATLYKVQVMYTTNRNESARATLVLTADSDDDAKRKARELVEKHSEAGVKEVRHVSATRNSDGVEFLGRQPA